MNTKKTFKNQELFSFVFKDQEFTNPNQFQIGLPSDFAEKSKEMLSEDKGHSLNPKQFAEMQLNIDVGIMAFYFLFIKVLSYQKRKEFLEYQFEQTAHKLTLLYRIESLACYNYWYSFGEGSYYNPETEAEVMEWVVEKYSGATKKKPSNIILLK
jgi:hypothetical protein